VQGLVFDINVQGHYAHFLHLLGALDLADIWLGYGFRVHTVPGLGYPTNVRDRVIWNRSQADELVLVTENRTADDADSLQATIADSLTPDSLPVLTIANKPRFENDRRYALIVAQRFADLTVDISLGQYRGVGRLFLPPRTVV